MNGLVIVSVTLWQNENATERKKITKNFLFSQINVNLHSYCAWNVNSLKLAHKVVIVNDLQYKITLFPLSEKIY